MNTNNDDINIIVNTLDNNDNSDNDPFYELSLINTTLGHLEITLNKYLDDVHELWEMVMVPFLNSPECLVFKYLGECDFKKFLEFMLTQDTFKLISLSQCRLKKREKFIINTINDNNSRPNTNKSTQCRSENWCK